MVDDAEERDSKPKALRDYALIADGERGVLVGPHGEYAWMCFPSWESPPVFGGLLGGPGGYVVQPVSPRWVWGGYYEDHGLVWHSRWVTGEGAILECREALSRPAGRDHAVLLRRCRAVRGDPASASCWTSAPGRARPGCAPCTTTTRTGRPAAAARPSGGAAATRPSCARARTAAPSSRSPSTSPRARPATSCWSSPPAPRTGRAAPWTRARCGRRPSGTGGRRCPAAPTPSRPATRASPTPSSPASPAAAAGWPRPRPPRCPNARTRAATSTTATPGSATSASPDAPSPCTAARRGCCGARPSSSPPGSPRTATG